RRFDRRRATVTTSLTRRIYDRSAQRRLHARVDVPGWRSNNPVATRHGCSFSKLFSVASSALNNVIRAAPSDTRALRSALPAFTTFKIISPLFSSSLALAYSPFGADADRHRRDFVIVRGSFGSRAVGLSGDSFAKTRGGSRSTV